MRLALPVDSQCCVEDSWMGDCSVRARMGSLGMFDAAAHVSL